MPAPPVQATVPTIREEEFVYVEPETPTQFMQAAGMRYQLLRQTMEHEAVIQQMFLSVQNQEEAQILSIFITTHFSTRT